MSTPKNKSDSQNTTGKVISAGSHIVFRKKQIDITEPYKNYKPSEVTAIGQVLLQVGYLLMSSLEPLPM